MKQIFAITLLVMVAVTSGCSMGVGKVTEREIRTDPITQEKYEVVRETTPSFWKSEDKARGYDSLDKKLAVGQELTEMKLESIDKARMERASLPLSNDARAYANALDMVVVAGIKTDINVSDIPIAKGMVEYLGPQAVALAQITLGVTGSLLGVDLPSWAIGGGSGGGSTDMDHVNIAGDVYTNGSIRKDNYDLGYQGVFNSGSNSNSPTEDNDNYEGNAQSSNAGGDGDTGVANPYSDDDSLL